jgi:hypothetical protein
MPVVLGVCWALYLSILVYIFCNMAGRQVAAGWFYVPVLGACWALYLSILVAGQTFLSFQWDILLLEVILNSLSIYPY